MIVAIEGGDQTGKHTQSALLAGALEAEGIRTELFHFPDYTTPVGMMIRQYLAEDVDLPPQVIHCLLATNRWEKHRQIQQARNSGRVLIMDRYYDSNIVYGVANGMDEKWLENLDAGLPRADLVILLNMDYMESFRRQAGDRDRFERNAGLLERTFETYRGMAGRKGWHVIDATRSEQDIHGEIYRMVSERLDA